LVTEAVGDGQVENCGEGEHSDTHTQAESGKRKAAGEGAIKEPFDIGVDEFILLQLFARDIAEHLFLAQ